MDANKRVESPANSTCNDTRLDYSALPPRRGRDRLLTAVVVGLVVLILLGVTGGLAFYLVLRTSPVTN